MCKLVIGGARLAELEGFWDIGIENERIDFVRPSGREVCPDRRRIPAKGRYLLPGLIDAHVHTRDPGYTEKEDFYSAARAAANGGVTTILAMPNTNPPLTTAPAVRYARERAEQKSVINVYLTGGACAAFPPWMPEVVREGAIALDVCDDIFSYGTKRWLDLFQYAAKEGVPLCFYLMDPALEKLRRQALSGLGKREAEELAGATNGETEALSIARIVPMAAYFGVSVVIRMVSTARAVEMIRYMKRAYPDSAIYGEVCISYLFLKREDLYEQGSRAHVHPPLRGERDMEALWEGLQDGTLDYIASDHAPHTERDKAQASLASCASGIAGIETMLPLLLDAYSKGKISLPKIQQLCCENPARIFKLEKKGRIIEGYDADLTLVDPALEWRVSGEKFFTRGARGPFEGRLLRGRPLLTICKGRIVMENGTVVAQKEGHR